MDTPRRSMDFKVAPFRASSPSPSIPATAAISSYSSPGRTFSSGSSRSTSSSTSADARSSVSVTSSRHGYTRAFGAEFAESARHRDSVMSLGSIAHLQYYFARTGLLDGKTGRSREWKKDMKNKNNVPQVLITPNQRHVDEALVEGECEDEDPEVMLPPTVSTYSVKTHHIPPPPDLMFLRRQLTAALDKAETNIEAIKNGAEPPPRPIIRASLSPDDVPETTDDLQTRQVVVPMNKEEAQGMCILDDVTNAIRAAKIYYTTHENPERLASIKSEREIRSELLDVLEVLKRWAARHFASGLRDEERGRIQGWFVSARAMIAREKELEDLEAQERQNWDWATGDWRGRERLREESFLRSLLPGGDSLPTWEPVEEAASDSLPTAFLDRFRDGRALVQLHNLAIKRSKRPFGEITAYHLDIAKPYRQTENLQFWLKAAQLRWELRLDVDVTGVVQNSGPPAWEKFDTALLAWCKTVREELVRDWQAANPGRPPSAGLI
ncbi:KAR9-domain-containing protein [Penicillium digitatum]|uniref:Calponin-homology (CH) domain-containing protein n=2 Tax=Penicillium digitatum TaxID=36651 RepID=K9GT06_PEND1|nr:hypothetical protein PDIP_37410 [Penicillium digitatum Pd1]EKV16226.1 hypothetical protein PDIP_37410 [Penicillium digitatum Pd1]KAG0158265.1 hypothetical protein PDIDSM_5778 [Penicillium digitatum]QQK42458.1 KAR9-domain-containing protein [Penicillium digitatum]